MSNNCKLCNRESTISIHSGLISCANPDCYMDEVEMPQEDWDLLMGIDQSLADIKAEAVLEVAKNWIINKDSDYTVRTKLIDISNKLRNKP